MELELVAQFLFGVGGALVIIYLRIFDVLPRMSGASMIKDRSLEVEKLSKKWLSLAEKSEKTINNDAYKDLRDDYQIRESEIRKEIRSLKFRQWALAATLYIILGGLFALVVFPLISEEKILLGGMLQPIEALKCMGVGFTWTTYITLLESKKPGKELEEIRDKALEEVNKNVSNDDQKVKEAGKKTVEAEKKAAETTDRYDKAITALNEDFKTYRENAKELIEKYKDLLGIK